MSFWATFNEMASPGAQGVTIPADARTLPPLAHLNRAQLSTLHYDHHRGDDLDPRWTGFHWEGFGYLLPAVGVADAPVRRFPTVLYGTAGSATATAFQLWEVRLHMTTDAGPATRVPSSPLQLRALYHPIRRVSVIGLEDDGAHKDDYDRCWGARGLLTSLTPRRGPVKGQLLTIGPEELAIIGPLLVTWRAGKVPWKDIKGRLTKRQADDPEFPNVADRHPDTLADWLREWQHRETSP